MSAGLKLGAYALVLAAALGAGAAVGAAAGPIDIGGEPEPVTDVAPHDDGAGH